MKIHIRQQIKPQYELVDEGKEIDISDTEVARYMETIKEYEKVQERLQNLFHAR